MRKAIGWIVAVLLVLLACGAVVFGCYKDYQNNRNGLKIQVDYSGVVLDAEEPLNPICFRVENLGYSTIEVRQTVVLSLYDKNGEPMQMGGTSVIPSTFDLYDLEDVREMDVEDIIPQNWVYPAEGKTAQDHQTVYVSTQYITENTPWYMEYRNRRATAEPARFFDYALVKKNGQELSGYTLRVDILVEGKDQQQWVLLDSYTGWLGDSVERMPAKLREEAPQVPVLSHSNSYQWEVEGNCARIVGIGNVTDGDIVIPYRVFLSAVGDQYIEDTISGQECYVSLQRGALSGCQSIRTVTFQEHTSTSEDCVLADEDIMLMDGPVVVEGPGFFEDCTNLTAVYNIPNLVTNMKAAFKNCKSLAQMPTLPTGTVNMEECFYGCESLVSCGVIPVGVTDMENCFNGCVSLPEAPQLPQDVRHLSGCFSGCTALTKAPELPQGVKDLSGCFSGCTAMTGTVYISRELITNLNREESLAAIFENCNSLETITVDYCDRLPADHISETVPVEFAFGAHNKDGMCEACRYVTLTTKIDGLKVVMDDVPEERYLFLIDYLDHTIPDSLKDTCTKLTFGKEVEVYGWDPEYDIAGYAQYPQRDAYVEYESSVSTLYHELAHCYDHYGTYRRFSASRKWNELFSAEEEQAKTRYGDIYETFSQGDQKKETFAIAVASYFTEPDWLKENCPGMYAYVEDLFGVYEAE